MLKMTVRARTALLLLSSSATLFSSAFGSVDSLVNPNATLETSPNTSATIETDIRQFRSEKKTEFKELTENWRNIYGEKSLPILTKLANNPKLEDPDRFIAILSLAHLHPKGAAERIRPFFKHSSWMLKSAALQSAVLLQSKTFLPEVMSLLKDPALVIRAEAADSLGKLQWIEAKDALLAAVYDPQNYRPATFKKGKADWVPQKALASLRDLKVTGLSRELLPLMNEAADAKVRAHALFTIEKLEKKELLPSGTFQEKRVAWNKALLPSAGKLSQGSEPASAGGVASAGAAGGAASKVKSP
jgi:HEAT repeat protein